MYKRKVLNNYGGLYMKKLIAEEYKRFEDIKQIREDGSEFWSAFKTTKNCVPIRVPGQKIPAVRLLIRHSQKTERTIP